MDFNQIIGYLLALLAGISIGMMGSGGSILTVPILVYIMHIEPVLATAYSLFIVGTSAATGSIRNIRKKQVNFKIVFGFGLASILSVFFTRTYLLPLIPDTIELANDSVISKSNFIMIIFALVMLAASSKMIKPRKKNIEFQQEIVTSFVPLAIQGILIGLIAGLVGAGGGFLIVPTLVFFAHLPMRTAIGTSVTIIAIQSLIGFTGDLIVQDIQWSVVLIFTAVSTIGVFIGMRWANKVSDKLLRQIFGWFVLAMAVFILLKEVNLSNLSV